MRKIAFFNKGFTFIEIIVVIGLISIVIPTLYAIFFLFFQQQIKINRLNEVLKQGDFIINTIESSIKRNAYSIHSNIPTDENQICNPPNNTTISQLLYFKDKNGNYFYFDIVDNTKIALKSAESSTDLTSSKVIIDPDSFIQGCTISGFSAPYVTYSFDLCYNSYTNCNSSNQDKVHFETSVTLPYSY